MTTSPTEQSRSPRPRRTRTKGHPRRACRPAAFTDGRGADRLSPPPATLALRATARASHRGADSSTTPRQWIGLVWTVGRPRAPTFVPSQGRHRSPIPSSLPRPPQGGGASPARTPLPPPACATHRRRKRGGWRAWRWCNRWPPRGTCGGANELVLPPLPLPIDPPVGTTKKHTPLKTPPALLRRCVQRH